MKPRLLITMGDVAGIGPEIIARAWYDLVEVCQPIVIGSGDHLEAAMEHLVGNANFTKAIPIDAIQDTSSFGYDIPYVNPSSADLRDVKPGRVSAAAGQAAYDWLTYAIDECLAKRADGIVTCPLHKEGLHAAGVPFPGHTEILASRCGAKSHAMLLYDDDLKLAVAHVTLHMAVRDTLARITPTSVLSTIHLLNDMTPRLTGQPARIGVMALNPHAGDGGLFGDEEICILRPAIEHAKREGLNVDGPIPSDAAFLPHNRVRFNALAAMIHDHGHIAMKLLGGRRAVNVTAGLPIVRTSVAHGTAYDIAGQGIADASSLVSAVKVAANLVRLSSSPPS